MRTRYLWVATAAMLSGCSLIPAYHRPASAVPAEWPTGPAYGNPTGAPPADARPAADIRWQEFFTDPQLRELIGVALENNRNLRVAALNIAAAQAQYRIQRSPLFPDIGASAGETAQRIPPGVGTGAGGRGGVFRTYNAGIGFTSYEIDFFGRIRSLDEAAMQRYLSQVWTRRSVQISLVAEVANAYLSYLADRSLLHLAQETLDSQQASLKLTQQSFDAGVDTALDVAQAQQAVDTAQADIAQFTRQVAQDRNALQLLLGAPLPADLDTAEGLNHEHFLESLPAGLPSDLLNRRPDIVAAEHALMAENANIGAARAAFFPSISLTGSFGTASNQLSGLFSAGSAQWTFAPTISVPIFSGGANVANLDLAHIEKNIAIQKYQQAIQTAFQEVSNALAGRGTLDEQIAAQRRLVDASRTSYDLSLQLFRQGVANFLSALDSQRVWYQAQQGLISTRLARLQNLVTLYQALGGGWTPRTVDTASAVGSTRTGEASTATAVAAD